MLMTENIFTDTSSWSTLAKICQSGTYSST